MVGEPSAGAGLTLAIPEAGLDTVLRSWSGQGGLWEGLASVAGELAERAWTTRDVRRRAHRVLFAELLPFLRNWPASPHEWIEAFPAESQRERVVAGVPVPGTSWPETRRHGWPPRVFAGRIRNRVADTLLVTTLRWALEHLRLIREDARAVEPTIDAEVRHSLDSILGMLDRPPLVSAEPIHPTHSDIEAMRGEGRPWSSVAAVAEQLRRLSESSLIDLARRLVMPSRDLRWRLFHLAVLGEVLLALRACHCKVRSLRPLSAASTGPAYQVVDRRGQIWELWFEAAGVWSHHDQPSPYVRITRTVGQSYRSLGADLLLLLPDRCGLVLECKFSADPGVVCRNGYEQAVTYATELRTHFAQQMVAAVVGPEGIVPVRTDDEAFAELICGSVGIVPPSAIAHLVNSILEGANP